MLMSLLSRLLTGWFAFLLPSYSTFKALKHRPISEPELERWTTYWAVVGAFVAFEYGAEWLLSWFPFYWEIKTAFLLYLSLPQLQGSSFIFKNYLEPFYGSHEADIDAGIASAQTETLAFAQTRLASLWEIVWSIISKTPVSAKGTGPEENGHPAGQQSPLQAVQGLWNAFGPAVLGSVKPANGQLATPAASSTSVEPSINGYNVDSRAPHTPEPEPQAL
ncbi:hypothetical protein HETIRDRAFT_377595 [Heterobasidion irregulare TC 32-1]|uniref:Protein YOP1 n=1 Tax=Heterobasidion irregulare (strain TC 32-1) TaxID=747525 RepID=W4KPF5_HETIT|nr:uncharacterized protein HETIRDRAFT_377595 [Heterobasidion irregulare TC 32-1]ETW86921.1 hypothetical protein HETIRDRAFT_377595 [Heterobasidion irregulare TC 32-1]